MILNFVLLFCILRFALFTLRFFIPFLFFLRFTLFTLRYIWTS